MLLALPLILTLQQKNQDIRQRAASANNPSGFPMQTGDLTGWKQVFSDDFVTPVTIGQFPGTIYANGWSVYPDGWTDTSKHGIYSPSKVLSVTGGVLDMYIHTEKKTHLVAAPLPNKGQNQLYGRYSVAFKSDAIPGYKTAWLLWPQSETWPRDGEIDFPEGDLPGKIQAYMHRQNATTGSDQDAFSTAATYTTWHVATTEWSPNKLVFILDGAVIGTVTNRVPNTPMHWVLQTETALDGSTPSDTAAGHVQIDWVSMWQYSPTTTVSQTPPVTPTKIPNNTPAKRGVNLFGGWQGMYGGVDTFASAAMLDYLKTKGLNTFRVGFAWEHLQPTLGGPLDTTYLAKMDTLVANAKARGQQVAFVPLPGKYKGNDVNTTAVPQSAFNDLWIKLATHYKNESAIWGYDLINEPNMGDSWNTTIAPSAIAAIRTVDMTHPIIVPTSTGGYGHYFTSHLAGLPMQDPANNLIYEAHFYFDSPPNGQYLTGFDVPNNNLAIGVERAKGFVDWCKANNQTCYAGEYGVPGGWTSGNQTCTYGGGTNNDPRWLTVLDNFLTYLDQNNISGTYWAAGPYGDINSVGPFCTTNGSYTDAPQMAILQKHLSTATTVPSPTVVPLSPTALPSQAPTTSISQTPSSTIALQLNLHGIGNSGDNANAVGGNLTPTHTQRTISLTLFDAQGQLSKTIPGTLTYSQTKKLFEGTLTVSPTITPGTYRMRLSSPGYLTENVPGIYAISGSTTTLQPTTLITGDAYADNKLDILDYNAIMTCLLTAGSCDSTQKTLTDLNDDGTTDIIDYNLFIRELSVQRGI